jgi:hypothetical protein
MDDQAKADLEKLETLRDQALFAPEDQREAAQKAYEELREKLFGSEQCETPGSNQNEKEDHHGG